MREKIIAAKKEKKKKEREKQQLWCQEVKWQIEQFKANLRWLVGNYKWTFSSYQPSCVTPRQAYPGMRHGRKRRRAIKHAFTHGAARTWIALNTRRHKIWPTWAYQGLKITAVALAESNAEPNTVSEDSAGCMCSAGRRPLGRYSFSRRLCKEQGWARCWTERPAPVRSTLWIENNRRTIPHLKPVWVWTAHERQEPEKCSAETNRPVIDVRLRSNSCEAILGEMTKCEVLKQDPPTQTQN